MGWAEWFYFFIIIQIIHGLGTWKLYKSANFNPVLSFIPIYNGIILLKIERFVLLLECAVSTTF